MKRRAAAALLALACLLTPVRGAYRYQDYVDLEPGAWYESGVRYCLEKNLMVGSGGRSKRFSPHASMTRSQLVAILWRMDGKPVTGLAMQYTDVPDDAWYAEAARWALAERLMEGVATAVFAPDEPVTREQLVSMLWHYAGHRNAQPLNKAPGSLYEHSADRSEVSDYAVEAMRWACHTGIIGGVWDRAGKIWLRPAAEADRAAVAVTLMRYCLDLAVYQ